MNLVPRITSTVENPIYNHFDITLETNTQKIVFKPYNIYNIPLSLSVNLELINNIPYYILNISQNKASLILNMSKIFNPSLFLILPDLISCGVKTVLTPELKNVTVPLVFTLK